LHHTKEHPDHGMKGEKITKHSVMDMGEKNKPHGHAHDGKHKK
jgi:hypothetical protein